MNSRFFQVLASLAVVAFFVCGQQALAEGHQYHIQVVQRANPEQAPTNPPPKSNLYALQQAFTATPGAVNTDGSDLWPCFGNGAGTGDCPFIGDPQVNFPVGGVAVGSAAYVWSYTNCDGDTSTSPVCGQTETWYSDDSNDTTDDLTYAITATQVQSGVTVTLADSGTVDFAGVNPFGSTPGAAIVIYGDQNFGDLGVTTGPNNGNCSANVNYPVASNVESGITYPYVIAAGATCVNPLPGLVTLTATTELAGPNTPKPTKVVPQARGCVTQSRSSRSTA